jgi:putative membrane protein
MKMMRWIYVMGVVAFACTACNDDDDNNTNQNNNNNVTDTNLQDNDRQFTEKAAMANMTEVEFGNLAATQGSDSSVRAFGQMMKTEHTMALNELDSLAKTYTNVTWPSAMDTVHQAMLDSLKTMSGHAFDSAYMSSQVADHQNTLNLFTTEIDNGAADPIKAYANKYRPHIQAHLDMADSINTAISNNGNNN